MKPVFLNANISAYAIVIFAALDGKQSRKVCYDSEELEQAVNAWDRNKRIDIFMVDEKFSEEQFWKDVEQIRQDVMASKVAYAV